MKIYLDYIFIINFLFDFILLLGTSIILKRNTSKIRLFLGSLFGGISFFIIFLQINELEFFIIKLLLAVIMVLITFSYKSIKYLMNNFITLIILSILMGGILYFINIEIGYSHVGLLFFTNGKSLNFILLILIFILSVIIYTKYLKRIKISNITNYKVKLVISDRNYSLNGFLDTGNNLTFLNKPVIILNKNINLQNPNIYVPFTTIKGGGVMKGILINKIIIDDKVYKKKMILAQSNDKFHLNDSDIILNTKLFEGGNNETIETIKTNNK